MKDDKEVKNHKPQWSVLPLKIFEPVIKVAQFGNKKYRRMSYLDCEAKDVYTKYYSAMLRHVSQHSDGEFIDPESGEPHLAHAATNSLFLLELIKKYPELENFAYTENTIERVCQQQEAHTDIQKYIELKEGEIPQETDEWTLNPNVGSQEPASENPNDYNPEKYWVRPSQKSNPFLVMKGAFERSKQYKPTRCRYINPEWLKQNGTNTKNQK